MTAISHVALLREFLDRRREIVEEIDSRVLNARGRSAGLPRDLSRLDEQLAAAHVADGFEPIALEGRAHALDPLELVARAHRHWERHRWPGRNVRLPFAGRVFYVFILRQIEHLSLRIWDDGPDGAADRLDELQSLLDSLNGGFRGDPLVRDVRWLIQTAQGPLTRRLEPYFTIAERIAASFTAPRRLEIHRAGALLTSGHLRAQLRHRASETDRPADDPDVLAITRNSNSMDGALLVRDLVPLLDAYGTACAAADVEQRIYLADAIVQGVSADPELLLTRLDLLTPSTMIESLFVHHGDDGQSRYTPMGEAHRHVLERYCALISRHAASLHEDAIRLDPRQIAYSPLGLAYGFCADILGNMALDTLTSQPPLGLSLEDMFASGGSRDDKRARVERWKMRPADDGAGERLDYSAGWAADVFDRTTHALRARAEHGDRANASDVAGARLFVESAPEGTLTAQEHCVTSDFQRALATGATAFPKGQLLIDRNEGRFLASAECDGRWFGISKVVLTLCTSQGKDALLTGVPPPVVDTLRLTCPGLVVLSGLP